MLLHDVCDYIITKLCEGGGSVSVLKLQKLVYYSQAYRLANDNKPLFDGKFQAWVHGPVSRQLYERFAATKSMYSDVGLDDLRPDFSKTQLDHDEMDHIDWVLEAFAKFDGTQLEHMTHHEEPWIEARGSLLAAARCEKEINEETMQRYYATRLMN
ncbi:MAG: Panacea domain-containing protein [Fimbriiglobus sp.]